MRDFAWDRNGGCSLDDDRLPVLEELLILPCLDEAPDASLYNCLGSHPQTLLPAFFISVSHLNEVMTEPALH